MFIIRRSFALNGSSLRILTRAGIPRTFSISQTSFSKYLEIRDAYNSPELLAYKDKEITVDQLGEFKAFDPKIARTFKKAGYTLLTPVQAKSIVPMMLEEHGVVCRAKTGTGKTMAFVLPTIQNALDYHFETKRGHGKVHTLIIAPTRDLALQIKEEYYKILTKDNLLSKIRVQLCIGGKSDSIRNYAPAIVVATPGRLEANLKEPRFAALFSDLKYRVYDEADRLLDQGFEDSLLNIDRMLQDARSKSLNPTTKMKSVLFSATVDRRVDDFATLVMGANYRYINCVPEDEPEAHENINQTLVVTKNNYEAHVAAVSDIIRNLSTKKNYKAILFVPTKQGTDFLFDVLRGARNTDLVSKETNYFRTALMLKLHGDISQGRRDKATAEFRTCKSGVLVCTDVAARGMDFKNVTDVVQICPSSDVADYVHKVGRTARAGNSGNATLYLSKVDTPYVQELERQRGVKFSQEVKYEGMAEDVAEFEKIRIFPEEVSDYIRSYLGYYRGIVSAYRLRKDDAIANVMDLYRSLLHDPTAKLTISLKAYQNLGIRDDRGEYFDVPGGIPRRGGFDKGRSNNNKRFGNSNSRGGYQTRGRRNDRDDNKRYTERVDKRYNDRNSKRTFDSRFY